MGAKESVTDTQAFLAKATAAQLLEIANKFSCDLTDVPAVGDSLRDIEAAQAVGAKPVLVRTGKGDEVAKSGKLPAGVEVYDDLAAFADALLVKH